MGTFAPIHHRRARIAATLTPSGDITPINLLFTVNSGVPYVFINEEAIGFSGRKSQKDLFRPARQPSRARRHSMNHQDHQVIQREESRCRQSPEPSAVRATTSPRSANPRAEAR